MNLARAVIPNAGVEAWYRDQLQRIVRKMSQDMLDRIRAAWNVPEGPVAVAMDAKKMLFPTLLEKALSKWGGLWNRRMDTMSRKIASDFAFHNREATEKGVKASLKAAGFTVPFKPSTGVKTAYEAVIAENVGLIKSIPQEFLLGVQGEVWRSVMEGGDLKTLTRTIQKKYGVAHRRAAFIARDQNNKAKAAMERARREALGISEAAWQHSSAGKEPRPTHVAMDGKRYFIAEGMYDSAIGKNTWPGHEPNCRCTDQAVIPGLE